jgi:hypothetical protein
MLDNEVLHPMYARVQVGPVVEVDAALFLLSAAPEVDHHLPRHPGDDQRAVVPLDERQGHVDARGHPGAADDPLVLYEEAVVEHPRRWALPLQPVDEFPVGRTTPTVE